MSKQQVIEINRAPVLTLWGVVVARRLGFRKGEALTLGKAVAGLNAQSKGSSLGIFKPREVAGKRAPKSGLGEELWIDLMGRAVPAVRADDGIRAVVKDKPIDPDAVETYLEKKFGDDLTAVRDAMEELARSIKPADLAERAYGLYERFRPEIPSGKRGWGAKGPLDLGFIRGLSQPGRQPTQ